jgi:hypothetical protein
MGVGAFLGGFICFVSFTVPAIGIAFPVRKKIPNLAESAKYLSPTELDEENCNNKHFLRLKFIQ